jgi:hypothetical protein
MSCPIIVLTETTALLPRAPGRVEPRSITLKRCSVWDLHGGAFIAGRYASEPNRFRAVAGHTSEGSSDQSLLSIEKRYIMSLID